MGASLVIAEIMLFAEGGELFFWPESLWNAR